MTWLVSLFDCLAASLRSRADLQLENLALRHQLGVLRRGSKRPRLRQTDRLLWAWLSRTWPGWRDVLVIVKPATVIAWRRRKFREYWTKLSRSGKPGRPKVAKEVRDLIRQMSVANPLWGSPHIVGELRKIGITLPRSTVAKYMACHRKPPSETWKSFPKNHIADIVAVDSLHRAHRAKSNPLRLPDPRPRATPGAPFQCDHKPHGRVDCSTDRGGVPVGQRAALPPA